MAADVKNWVDGTKDYFNDLKLEMRRVTWPSRKQVESTTVVVILSVFAFAAYFKVVDWAIQETVVRAQQALLK